MLQPLNAPLASLLLQQNGEDSGLHRPGHLRSEKSARDGI
jgi:hypothetical protein